MKVLIIEDEVLTSRRLRQMISQADDSIQVMDMLDSIESSVEWFETNPNPDLIFMDIQLADGLCFEIFNRTQVDCPVIFTTAFDEYAIRAFSVNSIDYLLKPVKLQELQRSLRKFNKLKNPLEASFSIKEIHEVLMKMNLSQPVYKSGFLVKTGQAYQRISCSTIACFYTENKLTYLVLFNGKKCLIDNTLDMLEKELDPAMFFRINRQVIVSITSVESMHTSFGGSLKLHLNPKAEPDDVLVSRRRTAGFKEWMNR